MAKNYASIGLKVEDANGVQSVIFVDGRFDLKRDLFFILNSNNKEIGFPLRFNPKDYLVGDYFRVIINFNTGTITPVPMPITYADPIRDIGVSSLVDAGVKLANRAVEGLQKITSTVTNALDSGIIPASLYQEIEYAKKQWIDAPLNALQANVPIPKASVNLIEGGTKIIYPVHLRSGDRVTKIKSRIDPGAEVSVISSNKAEELRAPVIGSIELGGFTGGSAVVPLVQIEAIVGKRKVIPVKAAVSDLVRQQTGKDFLVGAELFLKAKDAGELMI